MATITAAAVKKLRDRTDLPMMNCKKALVQAEGDEEKAIAILAEMSGKKLAEREGNVTAEGRIFQWVADDHSAAAMVEIQCESDPVSKNDAFVQLGEDCLKQLAEGPGAGTVDELLDQQSPSAGTTLREQHAAMSSKILEKIVVAKVCKLSGPVAGYVHHDGKTAVLFQADGEKADSQTMRDVAMHIAAMRPTVTVAEDLDAEAVKAERDRLTGEAKASGKPDNIIDKIVDGRMKAYYVENGVLNLQPFAKDDSKTVSQALNEQNLTAKGFVLWALGQG
ncbi:translation elongation factor Ts [Alienimonas chondri]|uniref:Elongation factor Ts n=1 Tax=Alienimonas chondri TaxID=2681879 RepID=A0ABX1VJ67_9PLAN|nr:translation elongation factor Ts [Alienimonas chondri]NNJ27501.1 Elongation factor Ts [Alienimonas chondri]